MQPEMIDLLDWEQSLRDAVQARDGDRACALVDEKLAALQQGEANASTVHQKQAVVDVLRRSLDLGLQILCCIRADLSDVHQQQLCMGTAQGDTIGSSCSFTA